MFNLYRKAQKGEEQLSTTAYAIKRFEASRPGVKVKITWYEKNPLLAALKTYKTEVRDGQVYRWVR